MALRAQRGVVVGAMVGLGLWHGGAASAQQAALQPISTAECQQFATKVQTATGFAMRAGEDDFTDLTDGSEGRACHIQGSASDQTYAAPGDLVAKIAAAFPEWRNDPNRDADGPGGAEKGYVNGNRIATIEVSWEPGPGVSCSDKEPLSACKIRPQQKLWTAIIDIVVKGGT
ncbi:MAG TPA: hypothetical protein VG651_04800 [Stellaceae bacterium]|nr:hypothetical protein [Stellaceae bacterium]